jgi:hypothetical protein
MKRAGRSTHPEWHNHEFVLSELAAKGCLVYVFLSYSNLMEAIGKIKFREASCSFQSIQDIVYQW